jgi:hypothetical protein
MACLWSEDELIPISKEEWVFLSHNLLIGDMEKDETEGEWYVNKKL